MTSTSHWHLLLHLAMIALSGRAIAAETLESVEISPTVTSFIGNYCTDCHGPKKQKAKLRFDTMPTAIGDEAIAQRWQDILDVLNLSEMPPEDADQPAKEELSNVLELLTSNLSDARNRLTDTGGQIVIRRLNRREYGRTIDALFDVPIDVSKLPDDESVDGFDTVGLAHGMSSLHLERYLELGRAVIDQSFENWENRNRKVEPKRQEAEKHPLHEFNKQIGHLDKKITDLQKGGDEGREERGKAQAVKRVERGLVDVYLADKNCQTGAVVPFQGLNSTSWINFGGKPRPGRYRVTARVTAVAEAPVNDLYLKVVRGEFRSKVPDAVDYYRITGTMAEPQLVEFEVDIDNIQSNRLEFSRRELRLDPHPRFKEAKDYWFHWRPIQYLFEDERADLWIDWIETEGPLTAEPPPLAPQRLLGDKDLTKLNAEDAQKIIARFAFEAFRHREVDPQYIGLLLKIFKGAIASGSDAEEALKSALTPILASPRFLFLFEPKAAGDKRRALDDLELAARLSYFLWSAPPDQELLGLAEAGELRQPDVLSAQIERLIRSPLSERFTESFLDQWLELSRLGHVNVDVVADRSYDDAIQRGSKREVIAFFNFLLRENLPATDLIDSDYLVVNELMAKFYGVPDVSGDAFKKVELPKDSIRGGLLGQSAILALTGTGERTSPVERGAYVLRKILHRPPAPAPANVPMLDEKDIGTRSIRETLSAHMDSAQCSSCHRRIDPLGFALENFDPVGKWRDDVVSTDGKKRFPIETAGVMPDGERKFDNFRQMKGFLSDDSEAFMTGLTKALMTYGLGRSIGFTDEERVKQLVADANAEGNGLQCLVKQIILSEEFLSK